MKALARFRGFQSHLGLEMCPEPVRNFRITVLGEDLVLMKPVGNLSLEERREPAEATEGGNSGVVVQNQA